MSNIQVPVFKLNSQNVEEIKQQIKEESKYIIVHTRDLDEDEIKLLNSYGTVVFYDEKRYSGLDIETIFIKLEASYIVFDLRNKAHKNFYCRIDRPEMYKKICVLSSIDKYHTFYEEVKNIVDNAIFKLPKDIPFKEQFDKLLLAVPISIPSKAASLFSCCLNMADTYKLAKK